MEVLSDTLSFLLAFTKGFNFNILDVIIFIVLVIYVIEGYSLGFVSSFFDLLAFVFSFALGLKFYSFFGNFLSDIFLMPPGFSAAIGFFITAMLAEIIFTIIFGLFEIPNQLENDAEKSLKIISKDLISIGTLNETLIHPREIFKTALLKNAAGIILAHNHPSGDTSPSMEDLKVTEQVAKAGNIIGVNFIDHVIVSNTGFLSIKSLGIPGSNKLSKQKGGD